MRITVLDSIYNIIYVSSLICKSLYDSLYKNSNISFKQDKTNSVMAMSYIRLLWAPAHIHDVIFRGYHGFTIYSEMGETLAKLDTFYVTN